MCIRDSTCVYTRHTCVHTTPVCTHATPVYTPHLCVHATPVRLPQVWCVLGTHFRPEVDVLSLTCSDADSDRPPWSRCPSAVSAVSDPGCAGDAWWSSDCHQLTTDVISILSRRASRCVYTVRYDTRCYFNVHLNADMSRLNLPHGNDNYKM